MKTCPTCKGIVPQGHGRKSDQIYCSKECYQWRNLPAKEEILRALNKTKNVTVTAHLFGTDKQALYRRMGYYGIKKQMVYVG